MRRASPARGARRSRRSQPSPGRAAGPRRALLGAAGLSLAIAAHAAEASPAAGDAPGSGGALAPRRPSLLPFAPLGAGPPVLLAQAEQLPAVPPDLAADAGDQKDQKDQKDQQGTPTQPPPPPAAPAAAQPDGACETDEQCRTGEICVESACQPARKRRVSALFYFHQAGARGYRVVVPFYFSLWSPRSQSRLLLPFFGDFRERDRDGNERRNVFLFPLLYQYHRDPGVKSHRLWPLFFYNDYGDRGSGAGLLPLFYGERRGDRRLAVLPPLLTFYRGAPQGSDLLVLGLAYARRRGATRSFFLPPLLSYYRDDPKEQLRDALILPALTYLRRHGDTAGGWILGLGWFYRKAESLSAGVFPLGWHSSDARRSVTLGLPLFLDVADREKGYHHTTLLPLFHHRTEDHGQYRLLVTPLGGFSHDKTDGTTTVGTLVPPLIYRDEPRRRVTAIPPLALFYRNKETGVSSGYVGPAFWHNDDSGSTAGLLPLYLRFHNHQPDATTHVLFPVGALHHGPQRWLGFLGPLYGWSRGADAPGGRAFGGGLLPLLSFASGPQSHLALLPPLLTWYRDREAGVSQVTVGPLFARARRDGYSAGLFPLLFLGSQRGPDGSRSSYQALLPLFYHRRDPRGEQLVVGPGYYLRDEARAPGDPQAGVRAGLFPLLFFKSTPAHGYGVVFPLLWYAREAQRQVLVAGPFFWQRRPVAEPGFAPGEETSAGLFPLAYVRTSPRASLFLSPVGGVYRDRGTGQNVGVLGPYVHFERRLADEDGGGAEKMDALLPLFYAYRSPQRSAYVAFPLYTQVRDGDFRYRSAALIYHGVERPGLSAHLLFPLFLRSRTARSSLTVVGPAFYRTRDEGRGVAAGLLPLFGYGRDEKRAVLVTPLGFYARNYKEDRTRAFFGLFYGDFRPTRSDFGLIPLFFASRRDSERTVVAPLLLTYHSSDPARRRDTTVAGPFFLGHRGDANFFGVLPLLFGANDGRGGYRLTLAPLFHLDHRPAGQGVAERTRFLSPLFGFARGATSTWGYLGPFYLRRDADQRSEAVFPLFYHGRNLRTNTSTTMLAPLFLRSTSPDATLTAVTPLLWHYSTLTRQVTFGFPFALDIHRRFQDRLTAVGPIVPLFVRYRDEAERSTTWVFPPILTYVKRHADGAHDVVLPPLLWHFGGFDRSTTVLFPLVWHLQRPSYTATVVAPLFGHVRNDEGGTRTLIPPLLTYVRRDPDGGRGVTVFPLFWHRSSAERSTTVLFPLVYHVRRPELVATVIFPLGAGWQTPAGRHTLVLNTYVFRGSGLHRGEWDFRFVPLIHVGRPRRTDIEWDVLEGLVGYSRLGVNRTLRLLWGIYVPLEPVNRPTAWYGATLRMGDRDRVF